MRRALLLALLLAAPARAASAPPPAEVKLKAALASPAYKAFKKENDAARRTGAISAAGVERLHQAHVELRRALEEVVGAYYELSFSGTPGDAAAADAGLKRANEAFPSYEAAFGGSGIHLLENRAYWGSLASIAEKGDAKAFLSLPLPPEWLHMRALSDLSGCYDPAMVRVDDILSLKSGVDALRSPYLKDAAAKRLEKYLEFAPEGFCVCVSLGEAKRALARINARLAPKGLRLGAELTPASNAYGEDNCRTE